MDEVARIWKGFLKVIKINVLNNPEIAQMFQIKGVPILIFLKDGMAVSTIAGALPIDQLNAFIERSVKA